MKNTGVNIGKIIVEIILIIGVIVTLVPFIWMILSSFKSCAELNLVPPTVFPKKWVTGGYERVFNRGIVQPYINTIIVSVAIVAFQLLTASMAAFAFARLHFPLKKLLFGLIIAMIMVPQHLTLITKYKIINDMGFADSLMGIIAPSFISISVTFFLRQAFLSFPKDLEDASWVDGCSRPRFFVQILLPLSKASLTAMGIMVLLFAWNDLLWPTIVITAEKKRVLSMFISLCRGQYIIDYGFLMAASTCAVLPMIIIYGIFQRAFVESIAATGIKG